MTSRRATAWAWALTLPLLGASLPSGGPGFRPLFDGRGLDGWRRLGARVEPGAEDRAFAVEDGLLVSRGEGGGWLGTDREFDDFDLRLEFRLTPGSNSGVYLRAPADDSHISRTGLEVQLLDEDAPAHRGIQPWQRTGALYHVAAPEAGHLRPPGEWNRLEVRALGPRVQVRLNDALVVDDRLDRHPDLEAEHPGLRRRSGLLGLQSHNGRVEFRDIRVRPLATPDDPAPEATPRDQGP